jgi:hypothetical protein
MVALKAPEGATLSPYAAKPADAAAASDTTAAPPTIQRGTMEDFRWEARGSSGRVLIAGLLAWEAGRIRGPR